MAEAKTKKFTKSKAKDETLPDVPLWELPKVVIVFSADDTKFFIMWWTPPSERQTMPIITYGYGEREKLNFQCYIKNKYIEFIPLADGGFLFETSAKHPITLIYQGSFGATYESEVMHCEKYRIVTDDLYNTYVEDIERQAKRGQNIHVIPFSGNEVDVQSFVNSLFTIVTEYFTRGDEESISLFINAVTNSIDRRIATVLDYASAAIYKQEIVELQQDLNVRIADNARTMQLWSDKTINLQAELAQLRHQGDVSRTQEMVEKDRQLEDAMQKFGAAIKRQDELQTQRNEYERKAAACENELKNLAASTAETLANARAKWVKRPRAEMSGTMLMPAGFRKPGRAMGQSAGEYISPATLLRYMRDTHRTWSRGGTPPYEFHPLQIGYIPFKWVDNGINIRIPGGWSREEMVRRGGRYEGNRPDLVPREEREAFGIDDVAEVERRVRDLQRRSIAEVVDRIPVRSRR